MLTGVGGQGVQLAAQVLARAATLEEREVMLFGVYSGVMRGGNSDSTVVVADGPLQAPPLISHTWSAIVMHHKYWEPLRAKIRSGGVVLVNAGVFEGDATGDRHRVFEVPATEMATRLGNPLVASMVIAGSYAGLTGLVALDSAIEAMRQSLPPYRQQHAEPNAEALRAGFEAVPRLAAPAWAPEPEPVEPEPVEIGR